MTDNAEKTTNRTEENAQAEDNAATDDIRNEDNVNQSDDANNDGDVNSDNCPKNEDEASAEDDGGDAGAVSESDGDDAGERASATKRRRNRRRGGKRHRRGKGKAQSNGGGNANDESKDGKPDLNKFDQAKLWPYHDRMTGVPSLKGLAEFHSARDVDLGELGVQTVMSVLMGVSGGGVVIVDVILRDLSQANLAKNVFGVRDDKGDLVKIIASLNIPQEIRNLVNGDTAPVIALTRRGSLVAHKGYKERAASDEEDRLIEPELFFKAKVMENGNLLDGKNRPVLVDDVQNALVAVRRLANQDVVYAVRGGCDLRRTHSRGLLAVVRPKIEPLGRGNRARGAKKAA